MRETGSAPLRSARAFAAVILLVAFSLMLTGCSLFGSDVGTKTVSEYGGRYHFVIPGDWQAVADSTVIAVYASEEMPSDTNALDTLSLIIINGSVINEEDVPTLLTEAIDSRSIERSWQDAEITEPEETTIGGRTGYTSEVRATTTNGVEFVARYYMIRTSGTEVLLAATMPAAEYDGFAAELDEITEQWFWHAPETTGTETTATTEATATSE